MSSRVNPKKKSSSIPNLYNPNGNASVIDNLIITGINPMLYKPRAVLRNQLVRYAAFLQLLAWFTLIFTRKNPFYAIPVHIRATIIFAIFTSITIICAVVAVCSPIWRQAGIFFFYSFLNIRSHWETEVRSTFL